MDATSEEHEDHLTPPYGSLDRRSTFFVATFNLIATIVGGGVLTLPYAFFKCGIIVATIFMVIAAWITNGSLQILCYAARDTGATSYGEVARAAFGQWFEWIVSFFLFLFLSIALVAYMILIRDIWTPLVLDIAWMKSSVICLIGQDDSSTTNFQEQEGNIVLLMILLFLLPCLIQRTLYALRFNCYIGFTSVSILCVALCYQAYYEVIRTMNSHDGTVDESALNSYVWIPRQWGDLLFSFPIFMLSFLCHFNVIAIQGALVAPSRQRMDLVIR